MSATRDPWLTFAREDLRMAELALVDGILPTRYPDALPGMLPLGAPSQADAREAIDLACNVLSQIEQILQQP